MPSKIENQLRRLLPGVSRTAVDVIPSPGAIVGLQKLADSLTLRRETAGERIKMPPLTLQEGGGDWDDIALVLMAAAAGKGFATRIAVGHASIQLQVLDGLADVWVAVGPPGSVGLRTD